MEHREKCKQSGKLMLRVYLTQPAAKSETATNVLPQPKPSQPPTPIPEEANTAFQQTKGDNTTTSSINPNTFAITGSRSGSISEQPKESGVTHI